MQPILALIALLTLSTVAWTAAHITSPLRRRQRLTHTSFHAAQHVLSLAVSNGFLALDTIPP